MAAAAAHAPAVPAARSLTWWQARPLPGHGLADRVAVSTTPEVLAYMADMNRRDGFAPPHSVTLDAALHGDVRAALKSLPPRVLWLAAEAVVAIEPMRRVGSTAYAESILAANGTTAGGFIVFDAQAIDRPANAWVNWRENSAFAPWPGGGEPLVVRMALRDEDTRRQAIRYILLHEIAHLWAASRGNVHPSWDAPAGTTEAITAPAYAFAALSWRERRADGTWVRRDGGALGDAAAVAYYSRGSDRARSPEHAAGVYAAIAASGFVSPYAASNPFEDFAESFANYVHVVLLGQPWEVSVHDAAGAVVARYGDCWSSPRCAAKRAYFATLFESE